MASNGKTKQSKQRITDENDLSTRTITMLKVELRLRGMILQGRKDDLIRRLDSADGLLPTIGTVWPDCELGGLKEELRVRGMPQTGRKSVLIARLMADDQRRRNLHREPSPVPSDVFSEGEMESEISEGESEHDILEKMARDSSDIDSDEDEIVFVSPSPSSKSSKDSFEDETEWAEILLGMMQSKALKRKGDEAELSEDLKRPTKRAHDDGVSEGVPGHASSLAPETQGTDKDVEIEPLAVSISHSSMDRKRKASDTGLLEGFNQPSKRGGDGYTELPSKRVRDASPNDSYDDSDTHA
ncbi:hypothetical protein DL764_004734 [Monosporascus ibericus]|uniref:SAP domain-containing protein n=1 Tax=Monosporascus ibericus TaxID=155417 RepID=A0A4Q4TEV8_9PEZI|nr:hypothetical protein DL764_004734 [Monosporascus ibericus]